MSKKHYICRLNKLKKYITEVHRNGRIFAGPEVFAKSQDEAGRILQLTLWKNGAGSETKYRVLGVLKSTIDWPDVR